jgi:TonB family protein
MTVRSALTSPLETTLARLRKKEQSPWGQIQYRTNLWLSRLEAYSFIRHYGRLRPRKPGAALFRSEPVIDLDSLFLFSLIFHLLLFFLLTRLSFSPPSVAKEAPVVVRILDLGQPAQETKKEPARKQPQKAARPQPQAKPAPAKTEEKSTVTPEPTPAPALPGPKVLAELPRENVASLAPQSAETLIQLPTRQTEAGRPSVATRIDALPSTPAEQGSPLPETLRRGESVQTTAPGSSTDLSALTSPDFAPYLEMIKKRVQSVWKYPEGISGIHKINVVFVLDRAGKLARVEVADSTDARLNSSAVLAMKTASPFPPIPNSLKDLAGWPLRMRFSIDFGVKSTR